jgi:hypothetical protein
MGASPCSANLTKKEELDANNPRVSTESKCYINLLNNCKRATEEYNPLRMSLQQPI